MAIERTSQGRHRAKPYYRGIALPTKICATRSEAEAWCAAQIALIKSGIDPAAGRKRVQEFIDAWLHEIRNSKSQSTYQTTQAHAKRFPAWLLKLPADEVTPADLQRVLNEWRRLDGSQSTKATLTRVRADLSNLFNRIVDTRAISASPARGLRVPSAPGPRKGRPLAPEDVPRIYEQWRALHPENADAALVLILTGIRWSELRALRVENIRTSSGITSLHVTHSRIEGQDEKGTKNEKPRFVPLTDQAIEVIRRAAHGKGPDDFLFPRLWANRFRYKLAWNETAPGHTLHDLRHTAISTWLAYGIDPVTARDWAGHSSIAVTNRYAHHLGTNRDIASLRVLNHAGITQAPNPDRSNS